MGEPSSAVRDVTGSSITEEQTRIDSFCRRQNRVLKVESDAYKLMTNVVDLKWQVAASNVDESARVEKIIRLLNGRTGREVYRRMDAQVICW